MVDEAIDGGGGGHGILEDAIPFAKDEVAGDDDAAPLVTLGEKRKQNFHLVATLLHVAEVVENNGVEVVERGEIFFEAQVAFGSEQALYQRIGWRKKDTMTVADQRMADGAGQMRLAAAR